MFGRIYKNSREEFERYGLDDVAFKVIKDMMEGCRSADDTKVHSLF